MATVLIFIAGVFVGVIIGVFVMALMVATSLPDIESYTPEQYYRNGE